MTTSSSQAAPPVRSIAERLGQHISGLILTPNMLPDHAMTQGGKISVNQPISAPRVHLVMRSIGMKARLNMMTHAVEFTLDGWTDETSEQEYQALMVHACQRCGMTGSPRAIERAVDIAAQSDKYHPTLDWIDSATWDGTDRIQALCETLVMANPAHNKWRDHAVRRWLKQIYHALNNWKRPRAEAVGYVLTLQGDEGAGKSFWVMRAVLPPQWASDGVTLHLDFNERDAVYKATKTPLVELGEVDATFRKSEVAALKNFLTTTVDNYRPSHKPVEVPRARCTVYAATVNPEQFLVDPTGERRFWTLSVERCNWKHGIDLLQLWAQVKAVYQADTQYWLDAEEEKMHAEVSEQHRDDSDAEQIVRQLGYLAGEGFTTTHMTVTDLVTRMGFKCTPDTRRRLTARLARCKWAKQATIKGKRGFWVPDSSVPMTAEPEKAMESVKVADFSAIRRRASAASD